MKLLDLTLPDAADNLALDEALLLAAENGTGSEVLRLWEQPTLAVVVGAGGSTAIDVNLAACEEDCIPVLRRSSGGGTVVLGPGCLCYSLVLEYARAPGLDQIPSSNRYVLDRVLNALRDLVPHASLAGTSDLAVSAFKFSGNAQQRKRTFFLHHGTLLCNFDETRIATYLNAPERQPDYRQNRPHAEFIMNLPVTVIGLKQRLIMEWQPQGEFESVPWEVVRELVVEKYGREEWNLRR